MLITVDYRCQPLANDDMIILIVNTHEQNTTYFVRKFSLSIFGEYEFICSCSVIFAMTLCAHCKSVIIEYYNGFENSNQLVFSKSFKKHVAYSGLFFPRHSITTITY
jgi:hypothetical protein